MTVLRSKSEIATLRNHLGELKKALRLSQALVWWPDYLFHCTDIQNAVSILRHGELLSRVQLKDSGRLQVDIASPQIIAATSPEWQDHVRLYFRPRTPTQYANEGFRPLAQQQLGAHCPVPVYLLFDAISVLARTDCLFTDGNVAAHAEPKGSVDAFKQIPFEFVYHDTWFDSTNKSTIVYHRNAEVLLPKRLDLAALRFVLCRSQAEYDTLLYLLPTGTRTQWAGNIAVRPNLRLFFYQWTFVEQVDTSSKQVLFRFNKGTSAPGPFDIRIEITETASGSRYDWHDNQFNANDMLDLSLRNVRNPRDYVVRLLLDEQLAYAGRYQEEELPF